MHVTEANSTTQTNSRHRQGSPARTRVAEEPAGDPGEHTPQKRDQKFQDDVVLSALQSRASKLEDALRRKKKAAVGLASMHGL